MWVVHEEYAFEQIFDRVCREYRIEHRLTRIKHPWRMIRMNRAIKEATVKRFYYDDYDRLRNHMANFISAYIHARDFWNSPIKPIMGTLPPPGTGRSKPMDSAEAGG